MNQLRYRIFLLSGVTLACIVTFFLIAPILGYPLHFPKDSMLIIQQFAPVFVGYMALGTKFFTEGDVAERDDPRLVHLRKLLMYSFSIYCVLMISVTAVFGLSNSRFASPGSGLSVEDFTLITSLVTAFLSATIGSIVSYSFKVNS